MESSGEEDVDEDAEASEALERLRALPISVGVVGQSSASKPKKKIASIVEVQPEEKDPEEEVQPEGVPSCSESEDDIQVQFLLFQDH